MCKWGIYKDVKLAHPKEYSGRTVVPVDSCLAELIQMLNDKGVHTLSCCCGHGKSEGDILIDPDSFEITEFGYCRIKLKPNNE